LFFKGFGARGEGTLTSKLIVLKNVNVELQSYTDYIINTYENVKRANRSTYDFATNQNTFDPIIEPEPNNDEDDGENNDDYVVEPTDNNKSNFISTTTEFIPKISTTTVIITTANLIRQIKNEKFHYLVTNTSSIPYTSLSYTKLLTDKIHDDYTGLQIINMLPIKSDYPDSFNSIQTCDYNLNLGMLII
jgi:TPP-dependent 2-oxoacid decarboxylase